MSRENVEIVRHAVEALNAGDVPEAISPDCRLENVNTAVSAKTYVGAEGWREWRRDMFGAFAEGARLEIDEVVADGDDYVVVITSLVGRGSLSDAPLRLRWSNAVWFRDGQMIRSAGFERRREALEAVGLRE